MDGGTRPRGVTRAGRLWHGVVATLVALAIPLIVAPTAAAAPDAPADQVFTAEAVVGDGGVVDVFATSSGSALQVDGQDGRFPTTPMRHDAGSTRFYVRIPVAAGQSMPSVTVRDVAAAPPRTVTVDVQSISITRATYDGTTLTVAAAATSATMYPLAVDAGGTVATLPSPAPVDLPLTAPPRTITVSTGAVRVTAPVSITGGTTPAAVTPAAPTATVVTSTLSAPRGIATVIDGSASTGATTFKTTIKSAPAGAAPTLVDDTTNKPAIVLPTWAAPTDQLPRAALPPTPTVVTFTASAGTQTSTVDVTVTPAPETVAVTTARSQAGSELQVDGTSTVAGAGPARTPPTQVVVYARTTTVANPTGLETNWVKIGSTAVDSAGAFSVRARPAPNVTYAQYLVQTSRGTQVSGALSR